MMETALDGVGPSGQRNAFEELRVRGLFLWVAGGLVFYASFFILARDLMPPGFALTAAVAAAWYASTFTPAILWIVLESGFSWNDLRHVLGPAFGNCRWYHLVVYVVLTILLMWGSGFLESSIRAALFPPGALQRTTFPQMLVSEAGGDPGTSLLVLLYVVGVVIILVPVVEEMVVRGILINRWAVVWNTRRAIVVSSLVFGACHWPRILSTFLFALFMALLYVRTRSLLVPIVCHAFYNAFAIAFTYLVYSPSMRSHMPESIMSPLTQPLPPVPKGILLLLIPLPCLVYLVYRQWRDPDARAPYVVNLGKEIRGVGM